MYQHETQRLDRHVSIIARSSDTFLQQRTSAIVSAGDAGLRVGGLQSQRVSINFLYIDL